MKLDALLTESEMAEFGELVQQATDSGAQAVRFWSEARGLIVIGLVSAGQLETWFASPAKSTAQAIAVQQVVLHGISQAAHVLASLLTGASAIASDAIKKAAH